MNKTNYAPAVGRLRALENKLLKSSDFERLLMASNAESILDELSQTPYSEHLTKVKDISEFELLLRLELKRTYSLVKELSLDPEITDLFF